MHTYGSCSLLQLFFPFLPLRTCLAFSPHRMFQNIAPSSTASACPLPAFHCAPTSPYPSIWCSQLFKKKYQLACMKSKREREIKGNCGNKALQKALTSQVFLAGRLMASLGHLPRTRGFFREGQGMARAQLSAGVRGDHSPTAPSAAAAPGHRQTCLHPSHQVCYKDCWMRGGLH